MTGVDSSPTSFRYFFWNSGSLLSLLQGQELYGQRPTGAAARLGTKRTNTGKLVKGKQKTVTDGPFAETKDIVGGYTLIEARDLDQAVELSKGCPIFEVEGAVEVRPVRKMNM